MRNYSRAKHMSHERNYYWVVIVFLLFCLVFEIAFGVRLWNDWQHFLQGTDAGLVDWIQSL